MKKFINSIIKLLINIVIILILIALCFIVYLFFISKTNNIATVDTVSHFKSLENQSTGLSNTIYNREPININLNSFSNINNTEVTTNNLNHFYYNQLDDTSRIIYDALNNNIENLKKNNYKINFSTKFNDLLHQTDGQYRLNVAFQTALDAFFYDHPELFYIDLTKISLVIQYTTLGPKTTYTVSIVPSNGQNYLHDYFKSEAQVNESISKIENIRKSTIQSLHAKSEYENVLLVHDALVNSLEYDSSTEKPNSHNIYGAFIEKSAVCEGYAKAFKYFLDDLGIESILVSGTATNSSGKTESHMWNYIKLDEDWYGVDVTWDDPIIIGGNSKDILRHDYFCKGNNVFKKSHIINNKISDEGMPFNIPTLSNKNYR